MDKSSFNAEKPVCIVVMPFLSVLMPSLGVSMLKAMLARHGIGSDIFYGSLLMYNHF